MISFQTLCAQKFSEDKIIGCGQQLVVKCRFFKEIPNLSNIKFTYTLKSFSIQNLCVIQNIIVITMNVTMRNIYIEETSFFQREKENQARTSLSSYKTKRGEPWSKGISIGGD